MKLPGKKIMVEFEDLVNPEFDLKSDLLTSILTKKES